VAALVPINPDELEDWVLATAPTFVRSMRQADADLRAGRTRPAADVFAEFEAATRATRAAATPGRRPKAAAQRKKPPVAAETSGGSAPGSS
jgi:hypothetical protein